MKRGWMRFWVSVSLAVVLLACAAAGQSPSKPKAKQFNELTLAGMRPGTDTVARAERLYQEPIDRKQAGGELIWQAVCAKELLSVDADNNHKIQVIRVSDAPGIPGDCKKHPPSPWRTGRGLQIGSPAPLTIQLYGEPDSRSPSSKGGQRLELLYYEFDWAGPEVPQVMEVLCTPETDGKPGRVVEITLAASSL